MKFIILLKSHTVPRLAYQTTFASLSICVENRKGSYRHWHDPLKNEDGKTFMRYPYGYIKLTEAIDGDAVDCYIGPAKESRKVFVVHQQDPQTGVYDEDKVMLGFKTAKEAKRAYLSQYNDPKFFGGMSEWGIDDFVKNIKRKKKHVYLTSGKVTK